MLFNTDAGLPIWPFEILDFFQGSAYGYACPDKRVSLSFKRRTSRGVAFRRYVCYYANGNGFRFDSQPRDFTFFCLAYFFSCLRVTFTGLLSWCS